MFLGCSSGKFVLVPVNCGRIWREFVFVPFFKCLLWLYLAGIYFGSYFFSFYCGSIWREFVLVPIFLASIVAAPGGKFFRFLFF